MAVVMDMAEEEAILEALAADEPGDLKPGDVLHRSDGDVPAPILAKALTSAGYAHLWNTQTGERITTNKSMLRTQLSKTREDGSKVFTTRDPNIVTPRGTYRCLLHPEGEHRAEYDALGLPTCHKDNLTSPLQVRLHMQHRHKSAWETIEEIKKDNERKDELEFRRQLFENSVGARARTPAVAVDTERPEQAMTAPKRVVNRRRAK